MTSNKRVSIFDLLDDNDSDSEIKSNKSNLQCSEFGGFNVFSCPNSDADDEIIFQDNTFNMYNGDRNYGILSLKEWKELGNEVPYSSIKIKTMD